MHIEVLKFPLVEFHHMLIFLGSLPTSLFISGVNIDDLTCDFVSQQMHLLLVLVDKVTHIDPILQVIIVLFLMINKDLVNQLVCFLLV